MSSPPAGPPPNIPPNPPPNLPPNAGTGPAVSPSGWTTGPPPGYGPAAGPGYGPAPGYGPGYGYGPPAPKSGPGPGLVPATAGVVFFLLGFLALSWGDSQLGASVKYTDLFKAMRHADFPHDLQPRVIYLYIIGVALFLAIIGAYEALMWCSGIVRSSRSAFYVFGTWGKMAWRDGHSQRMRVVAVIVQLVFTALHGWGLWELFDGKFSDAGTGAWMMIAGSGCLVLAAAVGPRTTTA